MQRDFTLKKDIMLKLARIVTNIPNFGLDVL